MEIWMMLNIFCNNNYNICNLQKYILENSLFNDEQIYNLCYFKIIPKKIINTKLIDELVINYLEKNCSHAVVLFQENNYDINRISDYVQKKLEDYDFIFVKMVIEYNFDYCLLMFPK